MSILQKTKIKMSKENSLTLDQLPSPKRCEKCFQSDQFNPTSNYCFRCSPIEILLKSDKETEDRSPNSLLHLIDQKKSESLVFKLFKIETPLLLMEKPIGIPVEYELETSNKSSVFMVYIKPFPVVVMLIFSTLLALFLKAFLVFVGIEVDLVFFLILVSIFLTPLLCLDLIKERIVITPKAVLIEKIYRFESKVLTEIPIEDIIAIEIDKQHHTYPNEGKIFIVTNKPLSNGNKFFYMKLGLKFEDSKWLVTAFKYCIYKSAQKSLSEKNSLFDW
jgi:hypothetical protein